MSMLAGNVTNATTTTLQEANKVLRYAKENNDVGLEYRPLSASKDNITFIAFSNASFACRSDLSSQGGYLVAMVDKTVAKGEQGHYNVLDWRSWKLARVSRSTLAAESQAASEAADSLLFTTTFWNLIWRPWLPLDIQANSGSDKRTTIEVLVTQDKLACSGSTTRWVSSEQQCADGLTKQSAAQLLADRLRSHMVKLKSGTIFQAAKKKNPQESKRTAEMFAVKRPGRAMMAMFAMCLNACTAATNTSESLSTTNYRYIDLNLDMTVLLFTAVLAFVLGNFLMYGIKTTSWTFWRPSLDGMVEEENLEEASMPTTRSIGIETELHMTEIMDVADHIREVNRMNTQLVEREIHDMEIENYRGEIVQIQQTSVPRQSYEAMKIHCEAERAETIRTCRRELREITQNPVYFTRSGRVWHSDPRCPSRFTDQSIQSRGYCTLCAHFLGREVPDGEFEAGEPVP